MSRKETLELIRKIPAYKSFRLEVLKRDNKQCVLCGEKPDIKRGIRLEVDHIVPITQNPELALDINNARTLCQFCHRATPTYGKSYKPLESNSLDTILRGNVGYLLSQLPKVMSFNTKGRKSLVLRYLKQVDKWECGYCRGENPTILYPKKRDLTGDTPEEAVMALYTVLQVSAKGIENFNSDKI